MVSSGIRIGAWDYLKREDVKPKELGGHIVAASLKVYSGTKDEYMTFISAEAYNYLKTWVESRAEAGERITTKSWLMRDLWEDAPSKKGGVQQRGIGQSPKKLTATGVVRLIERALFAQDIRKHLEPGKRRYEFQAAHGFRKFFATACDRRMKSLHTEKLLGHDTGLKQNYNRESEDDLLQSYLKAVPDLTFFERITVQGASTEEVESLRKGLEEANKKIQLLIDQQVSALLVGQNLDPKNEARSRVLETFNLYSDLDFKLLSKDRQTRVLERNQEDKELLETELDKRQRERSEK